MGATGSVLRHTVKKERPAPMVRTTTRRNAAGHDLGSVELAPAVFGLVPNRAVLHQVVTAQLAATRSGTQSTRAGAVHDGRRRRARPQAAQLRAAHAQEDGAIGAAVGAER
jgi:hypothetical protein